MALTSRKNLSWWHSLLALSLDLFLPPSAAHVFRTLTFCSHELDIFSGHRGHVAEVAEDNETGEEACKGIHRWSNQAISASTQVVGQVNRKQLRTCIKHTNLSLCKIVKGKMKNLIFSFHIKCIFLLYSSTLGFCSNHSIHSALLLVAFFGGWCTFYHEASQ